MSFAKKFEAFKKTPAAHMIIAMTFFVSGFMVNIVQLTLFLTVRPFSLKWHRKLNYYLTYVILSQFVFIADWYCGSSLKVYMTEEDRRLMSHDHMLVVKNHSYEIDWLIAYQLAEPHGFLGNCKAYAKKILCCLPVIGWCWYFAEMIFLNRSFEKDKDLIQKQVKEVYDFPDNVALCFYAEGTRFTETKHKAALKFAAEKGLTPLKHHLIPRTKGFTCSLPSMRAKCDSIYDMNVVFKKDSVNPPTVSSLLNGKPLEAYMYVRRIPLTEVPVDEVEAAKWLHKLYEEKDRLIDSFHETGDFFKTSGFEPVQSFYTTRSLRVAIIYIVCMIISVVPVSYTLIVALLSGNWILLMIILGIIGVVALAMRSAAKMSTIKDKKIK